MYVQAILPAHFNPYAPAAPRRAPIRRLPRLRTPSRRSRRTAVLAVEVASWLAAPVGLAAFLMAT